LAGEADTLRFTTGKRIGGTVERKVVEPDIIEKLQAAGNLPDDTFCNGLFVACQFHVIEKLFCLPQRPGTDGKNRFAIDRNVPGFTAQACPSAFGTFTRIDEFGQFLTYGL